VQERRNLFPLIGAGRDDQQAVEVVGGLGLRPRQSRRQQPVEDWVQVWVAERIPHHGLAVDGLGGGVVIDPKVGQREYVPELGGVASAKGALSGPLQLPAHGGRRGQFAPVAEGPLAAAARREDRQVAQRWRR